MNTKHTAALAIVGAALSLVTIVGCANDNANRPDPRSRVETHGANPVGAGGERRDDKNDRHTEAMTGWEKLGERSVDGKMDHDTITVGKSEGTFRAIQLKVEHGAIEMYDLVITFGDGSTFSPPTRLVFKNGDTSKVVDLPGDKRVIKKIDFKYGNANQGNNGSNAQVEVWAK